MRVWVAEFLIDREDTFGSKTRATSVVRALDQVVTHFV